MKRQKRAFKINWPHRFADGRHVPRSPYYETENPVLIEHLIRSQGAQELELQDQVRAPKPLATQPTPDREPDLDEDVTSEEEPKWDFRTISDMRAYLDASQVDLPGQNARKAVYVQLCKGAWQEGLRPHPLYGIPGGPQPSPGMPGPNSLDVDTVEDAIATAKAAKYPIPELTLEHLDSLRNPTPEPEPEAQDEPEPDDEPEDDEA